ncbi:MAG: hypothetical protein K9N06_01620 [Candidatus Cloacimonetes bacterium]|nr:hypothetical protein [Candidatus Cloacimonadota bacterium]
MRYVIILLLTSLLLAACTAGPNPMKGTDDNKGKESGFIMGFWHGLISIVTLIFSIFTDRITVYEVHNNGFLYNFGFLLGAGVLTGGTLWSRKKK